MTFVLDEKRKEVRNLFEHTGLTDGAIKVIIDYIEKQDKEFIKLLWDKRRYDPYKKEWVIDIEEIDKLAGPKLVEEKV